MLDAGTVPGDPDPGNLPPDIRGQLAQEPHQHHQLPGTHHPSPPPPARPRYYCSIGNCTLLHIVVKISAKV